MPVSFYNQPWMGYQLPVGPWPLFGEKETTAVAFTGFSNPRSVKRKKPSLFSPLKQKRKVFMPRKRFQICTTSRPFSQFLTPTHFLFLPYSLFFCLINTHTDTQSIFCFLSWEEAGKREEKQEKITGSFTCLIISGDEGHSQNSLQLFCLWAAFLPPSTCWQSC